MAKDPAFLFYYQDFLVGTSFMTLEEIGAYIKLLCFQADRGPLAEKDILKKIPSPIWEAICCKFLKKDGVFFNERLLKEVEKRRVFTESRRKNLHMGSHMDKHMGKRKTPHMENENENKDINKDKYLDFVFLTKNEYDKLTEQFGEQGTKDRIEVLNNGIGSKGYKYKSHYFTILSWERKDNKPNKRLTPAQQYGVDSMKRLEARLAKEGSV